MSKYLNKKTEIDGKVFDSKKEAKRYLELKAMEERGEISLLRTQYTLVLIEKSKYGRQIKYVADFTYLQNGIVVVEDVKSPYTAKNPIYRLKQRMVAEKYDVVIKEVY